MQTNFDRLLTDFQTLTTQFGFWAESKRNKLDQRLVQIQDDLNRAYAELASLRIAFTATASVATAAMPIAGIIAKLAGPFAPLVIVNSIQVPQRFSRANDRLDCRLSCGRRLYCFDHWHSSCYWL